MHPYGMDAGRAERPSGTPSSHRLSFGVAAPALCQRVGALLDQRLDVRRAVLRGELGRVALYRHTVLVDEELLKVPGDVRATDGRPQERLTVRVGGDVVRARSTLVVCVMVQ